MRILVYEYASGGGLAGWDMSATLAREGAAMRAALIEDLCAIGSHQIITTADARARPNLPRRVEVVTLPAGDRAREAALDALIGRVDAVWPIAPETDRCLERLAAKVDRQRKTLLGSCADAVARASDKARLPRTLADAGVDHPFTRVLPRHTSPARAAAGMRYPIVVKPARGAGSHGVGLARNARELRRTVAVARGSTRSGTVLLQQFVPGSPASVSLLANGRDVAALTLNAQAIGASPPFGYRGGLTPFDHPLAPRALAAAVAACRALPGLRGFVGVDVILTGSEVVVIEVNPRLTTAYLGVRAALDENVAALALAACAGDLPMRRPRTQRRVRFSASGGVAVLDGTTKARNHEDPPSWSRQRHG